VARIFCPHSLTPKTGAESGRVVVNHVPLVATSLTWITYGRDVLIEPVEFESFFLLQIVRSGRARVRCGKEETAVAAGEGTIVSPTERVAMHWDASCAKTIVRIERSALERFAETFLGDYLRVKLEFGRSLRVADDGAAAIGRALELLMGDFEADTSRLARPHAVHFEQALFASLLLRQPNSLSTSIEAKSATCSPREVKKVEDYISARAEDDIRVEDLVAVAGVSARTLFDKFRRARGTSPMQFLRRVRLDRVRAELLRGEPGVSVTDIALRWNFDQLGRFAQYYRTAFGETPSQTLRRAASRR